MQEKLKNLLEDPLTRLVLAVGGSILGLPSLGWKLAALGVVGVGILRGLHLAGRKYEYQTLFTAAGEQAEEIVHSIWMPRFTAAAVFLCGVLIGVLLTLSIQTASAQTPDLIRIIA
jgi:hypothetical protein